MTIAVDFVREKIQSLYDFTNKPRADDVQAILDDIESVADEKTRTILFVTAKQYLGNDLKDLIVASRARANRRWNTVESN